MVDQVTTLADPVTGEILLGEALLTTYADILDELEQVKEQAGRIEMAIIRELHGRGDTEMVSKLFRVTLENKWPKTGKYEHDKLTPLKEMLDPDEFDHCWEQAHEKRTTVPAKFNTVKMESIVNKRGGENGERRDILARALSEGTPYLKLEKLVEAS